VNGLTTEVQQWHSGVRLGLEPIFKADATMLTQRELVASQSLFIMETMMPHGLTSQDNRAGDVISGPGIAGPIYEFTFSVETALQGVLQIFTPDGGANP
jgi:hypothetical protein